MKFWARVLEPLSVKDYSHLFPVNQHIYFRPYWPVGHKKIQFSLLYTLCQADNKFI